LPFYFWFFLLDVFPILYSAYLSFHKWDGLGEMKYRGLANYTRAFKDTRFIGSLKTTAYLWLGHIFIMLALALLLAVVLDSKLIRGRTVYRAIFYLPNVTPIAAMALVFGLVFDHHFGILNAGLAAVGLEAVPWLTKPNWARVSIIILNTWGATGWYMLIMLAGLQSIDPALYEAAEVDGSNALQKLFYITIPSLKNILFFCFIVETIGSFEIFIEPNVLTGGGPLNATLSTSLYLYNTAFQYNKFGYSAAMSFVLFAIIAVASAIQLVLMRREEVAYA
jgi:lactose/L-arabinose transport system permease protein